LKTGTFLEGFNVPLPAVYRIMFLNFAEKTKQADSVKESGLSKVTVSKIYE